MINDDDRVDAFAAALLDAERRLPSTNEATRLKAFERLMMTIARNDVGVSCAADDVSRRRRDAVDQAETFKREAHSSDPAGYAARLRNWAAQTISNIWKKPRQPMFTRDAWPPSQEHGSESPTSLDEGVASPQTQTPNPLVEAPLTSRVFSRREPAKSSLDPLRTSLSPKFSVTGAIKSGDIVNGNYKIEKIIGTGGMGEVWSAHDFKQNRNVALKLILPQEQVSLRNGLRKRLVREANAYMRLCHPNIIEIFDTGELTSGEPFIVLERLHGQTLRELLAMKRRLEPALAVRIAGDVASGLAVAHAAHVIHRDLKPANIFLHRREDADDETFTVKVIDFGACKALDTTESVVTEAGSTVGSPAYMSPEQVAMCSDIDHRTDIWSLGVLLFEMLTGELPFSASVDAMAHHIVGTPVPAPSSRVRYMPEELDAVVARCTALKREHRFASADELASALFMLARTIRPITRVSRFTRPPAALERSCGTLDVVEAVIQESVTMPSHIVTQA